MKKRKRSVRKVVLLVSALVFVIFILFPVMIAIFAKGDGGIGNVALIPINGQITGNGGSQLGISMLSSKDVVKFIEKADENKFVKVILLEINSPGGSAVASDEIASAVKNAKKPVVSLIREVGASGGYWIASASDYVIANKMSITGSIGVISSYLEFSGLFDKYGVEYERLVAGKYKDVGTPFRELNEDEREMLQLKINKIHDFFIDEIAKNRGLSKSQVKKLATGEIFLGVEALKEGLIDQLGDKKTVEEYIKKKYKLEKIEIVEYKKKVSLLDVFGSILSEGFVNIGKGIGSVFISSNNQVMMI